MIKDENLDEWWRNGFTVVENWLHDEELVDTRQALYELHPTWERYAAEPDRWPAAKDGPVWESFPYSSVDLSLITMHPDLVDFARRALGTEDLLLAHSELLVKYAGTGDFEQELHRDYRNNTLLAPPEPPEMVLYIWYYEDVTIELGPTHVVPSPKTDHIPLRETTLARDAWPEMYEDEIPIAVPAGSLLIYTMRTYHRGSRMDATRGMRASHHATFMRGDVRWGGWRNLPFHAGTAPVDGLMSRASVQQRALLGVPAPGSPYWTARTLAEVEERYPDGDWTAYRQGALGS